MAAYDIEHACGHTLTHYLTGPSKDRKRKMDWFADRDCKDCWRAALAAMGTTETPRATSSLRLP